MAKLTIGNVCSVLNDNTKIKVKNNVYHLGNLEIGKTVFTNPNLTFPLAEGVYGILGQINSFFTVNNNGVVTGMNYCNSGTTTPNTTSSTTVNTTISSTTQNNSTTQNIIFQKIGSWLNPNNWLVVVTLPSGVYLFQTNSNFDYLTPRGINLFKTNSEVTKEITDSQYDSYNIKNEVTGTNGLQFANNIPDSEVVVLGYNVQRDQNGNFYDYGFVKSVISTTYHNTSSTTSPVTGFSQVIIGDHKTILDRKLWAIKFDTDGWWICDGDYLNNWYHPKGGNFKNHPNYTLRTDSVSINVINSIISPNTNFDGHSMPSTFPFNKLINLGYYKDNIGANDGWGYIKNGVDMYASTTSSPTTSSPVSSTTTPISTTIVPGNEPIGVKSIPTNYPKPDTKNKEVFAQFPTLNLPENIISIFGYGAPAFGNPVLDGNGKVKLLSQGVSNIVNLDGLTRDKWATNNGGNWESDHYYYFNQVWHLARVACQAMLPLSTGQWGNIQPLIDNRDYTQMTIEGVKEVGRRIIGSARSLDDLNNWNIGVNGSVTMLDEESMAIQTWEGGSHYEFLGYIMQGMYERSGGKHHSLLYAQGVSQWFNSRHGQFYQMSDAELLDALNPANINVGSVWNGMRYYMDSSGGYFKVPYMTGINLYKKDGNGNFLLDGNGKRVYSDVNESINIYFSQNVPIYAQPVDSLKWHGYRPNGNWFEGWQPEWGTYDNREMTHDPLFVSGGWVWGNGARPSRINWTSEQQSFVEITYTKADALIQDIVLLSYAAKGVHDATDPNPNHLLYFEHRPVAEPWTAYGNSIQVRELGDGYHFYAAFLAFYSGAKGISTWDDGRYNSDLADNGQGLYWDDVPHYDGNGNVTHYTREYWNSDWTRYHGHLKAVQEALKPLEGTDAMQWKHIHFYYPYIGRKYSEVISSGVYHGGKLHVFFLNPSLENGEGQNLILTIGSTTHNLRISGHEVYYQTFDAPNGLTAEQFTLEYYTIYGKRTKVNGKVTNDRNAHYLIG